MRVTSSLLLLALAVMAMLLSAQASPSLDDLDLEMSMLEAEAEATPSASSVLADAQAYASSKIAAANEARKTLLAAAAAEGRAEAKELGPAPAAVAAKSALGKESRRKLKLQAKAEAAKIAAEAAKKAAIKAAKAAALKIKKEAEAAGFASQRQGHDKQGVFGAVNLGLAKVDTVPSTPKKGLRRDGRTALNRFDKSGKKKNIYGRKQSCLKDIAAHFDEADIYESKKLSLLQQMDHAKSRAHAIQLRSKLSNLETWHQMMQKKFMASSREQKDLERRQQRLFDAHLPKELLEQLKANKVAKRAAQKIPFPHAHEQALAVLNAKRKEIERGDRLVASGRKRMLRPEINNKGFPSMDPISSHLREKLWRNVRTQNQWSTDKGEMELAEQVVTKAHKAHGDFVEGPIAAPLLKGKLYEPETEKLGVPHFLKFFPWPKKVEEKVTMDDKVKVEQTYHQTW